MTAARKPAVPTLDEQIDAAFVDMLLDDLASHPDLYGVDPAMFGLRTPEPDAPLASPPPKRSPRGR